MISQCLKSIAAGDSIAGAISEDINWNEFCERTILEGVAPLFYPAIKSLSKVPENIKEIYKENFHNALIYKDLCVSVLKELYPSIADFGTFVLIQGIALWENIYSDLMPRHMNDIDLYIVNGNMEEIRKQLELRGFEPYKSYTNVYQRDGLFMDLHKDLWGESRVKARQIFGSHQKTELISSNLVPGYYLLSQPLLAVYTSFHALKHAYSKKMWDMDIALLYKEGYFDSCERFDSCNVSGAALEHIIEQKLIKADLNLKKRFPVKRALRRLFVGSNSLSCVGEVALALSCPSWYSTFTYLFSSLIPGRNVLEEMYGKHIYPILLVKRLVSILKNVTPHRV